LGGRNVLGPAGNPFVGRHWQEAIALLRQESGILVRTEPCVSLMSAVGDLHDKLTLARRLLIKAYREIGHTEVCARDIEEVGYLGEEPVCTCPAKALLDEIHNFFEG